MGGQIFNPYEAMGLKGSDANLGGGSPVPMQGDPLVLSNDDQMTNASNPMWGNAPSTWHNDSNARTQQDPGVAAETNIVYGNAIPTTAYSHPADTWDLGQQLNGTVDPYHDPAVGAIKQYMYGQPGQAPPGAVNGGVFAGQRPDFNAVQLARMGGGYNNQDPSQAYLTAYNNGGISGTNPYTNQGVPQAQPGPKPLGYDAGGRPYYSNAHAFTDKNGTVYDPKIDHLENGVAVGPSTGTNMSQLTPDQQYQRAWGVAPAHTFTPGVNPNVTVARGITGTTGRERGGA
jgi:hypothetical protein